MGSISSLLSSASSLTNAALSSNSNSTSSSSGTSGSTNYFAGLSTYSQQLQEVIGRSVSIASLPIEILQSQQAVLNSQATELSTLDSDFAAIQTAIQNISDALGGSGMNSDVSNSSVASVTLGDGAAQGFYSVQVSNIGAYATSLTSGTWVNAVANTSYNLVIGGKTYSITPSNNSATAVAATINAEYGNLVQATAVNVGSAANPDYRISLQSANLGPLNLEIQAQSGASLQSSQTATTGYATSLTADTWDSSGAPSSYALVVDGTNYTINPTDNSAQSVAAAINAMSGTSVHATVVNLGTADSPDERIQLQATNASVANVDLQDSNANSLQDQQTPVAAGSAVSQTSWTWDPAPDPSGNPTQYTLTIGDNTQTFTVDDNSAMGVAAAINALSGISVTATVVDAGTASAPDYRIQLIDNSGSGNSPQLTRSTAFNVQSQGPAGSLAEYEVDNSGTTVSSNSRQVQIAAGTNLTLTGTGTTDVTVTQSASALNTALSGFADAYNAAKAELAKQFGQSGGPLQGQSIVYRLSQALSQMSTYFSSASGSISMADLGFTLNMNGTLTYSALTMLSTELRNSTGVTAFLGSATGGGFLEAATNAMNAVEATGTGLVKSAESSLQSEISALGNTITQKQSVVSQMQASLINQMAKADAAIELMQQQYTYMNSVFQAEQTSNQMFANGY